MENLYRTLKRITVVLLFIVLFIYSVIQARMLLYPFMLAILMAYLLYPVANRLEKIGVPRIPVNFIVIILSFSVVAGVFYLLVTQTRQLLGDLPSLKSQASENVKEIGSSISHMIGMEEKEFNEWVGKQVSGSLQAGGEYVGTFLNATTGTVAAMAILPVYVFLLLYYRDKLHRFFMSIIPKDNKQVSEDVIQKISSVTMHYMRGVCTVVLILCVINSAGLWLIGVPYALLLGIISAVCNFIPYFGTILGAAFPLAMALFGTDDPTMVIQVAAMFLVVQFTENNILTPNITGGAVQINPMVTILGIVAGGLVWGLPGMFVIVPILGMLKIVLESNPETQSLAFLLSTEGTERHSFSFEKLKAFFKRGS